MESPASAVDGTARQADIGRELSGWALPPNQLTRTIWVVRAEMRRASDARTARDHPSKGERSEGSMARSTEDMVTVRGSGNGSSFPLGLPVCRNRAVHADRRK